MTSLRRHWIYIQHTRTRSAALLYRQEKLKYARNSTTARLGRRVCRNVDRGGRLDRPTTAREGPPGTRRTALGQAISREVYLTGSVWRTSSVNVIQ
jgi:hypothetical protein